MSRPGGDPMIPARSAPAADRDPPGTPLIPFPGEPIGGKVGFRSVAVIRNSGTPPGGAAWIGRRPALGRLVPDPRNQIAAADRRAGSPLSGGVGRGEGPPPCLT